MNRLVNLSKSFSNSLEIECTKEKNILSVNKLHYHWTTKPITPFNFSRVGNLKNKTIVISGASRGIGLAIAKRAARDGANIAILAKTIEPHPKLPGTIYTAAKEIEDLGGKSLPIQCDIRDEASVKMAIEKTVKIFGGIDILINNASAINLSGTEELPMKRFDLMHQINSRGTFMMSKYCVEHLKKSKNPHILNISPPLNMDAKWFKNNCGYTMAKYGMSLCVLGMSEEFKDFNFGVNALWPKTAVATAAVKNLLGGDAAVALSRNEDIMSDSAYVILTSNSKETNGNFFIDDEVLSSVGVHDLKKYQIDKTKELHELQPDFFL